MTIIAISEAKESAEFCIVWQLTIAVSSLSGRVESHRGQEQGKAESHQQKPGNIQSRPVVAEVLPSSSLSCLLLAGLCVLALDLGRGSD